MILKETNISENLPERDKCLRSWLAVGLIYTAIVFACFSPWWMQGKVFAPLDILNEMLLPWRGDKTYPNVHNHFVSDAVTQYIPYHMLAYRSLREDGYIGWNPYEDTGSPFHANTMALPGDWTLQLYRIFDFWTGWHLGLIGQFLLAGLGMLVFLRSRGIGPWAALAGAIIFAGNAQFIAWFYHRWALGSFCWMPWVFWALYRWRQRGKGAIPLLVAFLAFSYLGGTLQHLTYIVLAVGCFWAAEIIFSREVWKEKARATLVLALVGFVAFLIASPTLIPCIEAFVRSRMGGDSRGAIGYHHGMFQPIFNLIAYGFFPFPSLLGSPQTMDGWKVLKSDLLNLGTIGFLPTLLAFIALFKQFAPRTARLLIFIGLLIPLTPLVGPLYHRVLLLFALGGSWVFADFMSNSSPALRLRISKGTGILLLLLSFLWSAVSISLLWFAPLLKDRLIVYVQQRLGESQFGFFDRWFMDRTGAFVDNAFIWHASHLVPLILAAASVLILYIGSRYRISKRLWQGGISVILFIEVIVFCSPWITALKEKDFPAYKETEDIIGIRGNDKLERVYIVKYNHLTADSPLPPNTPSVFGIPVLNFFESIAPTGLWARNKYQTDYSTLQKLGVTHILLRPDTPTPPSSSVVFRGKTMVLCELANTSTGIKIISPNRISIAPKISSYADIKLPITYTKYWTAVTTQDKHPIKIEESEGGLCFSAFSVEGILLQYRPSFLMRYPFLLPVVMLLYGISISVVSDHIKKMYYSHLDKKVRGNLR